jgi:iron complex outermembrane receptor protein
MIKSPPGVMLVIPVFTLLYAAAVVAADVTEVNPKYSATSAELGEIVVTAQKREEVLSKVPIAISVLSGDQLTERGYTGITDLLGAVPNLTVVINNGVPYLSIRGVFAGDSVAGADPSVAFHMNGVYLATHEDTGSNFYDIARVEVLKGPQGTLFGRNALGGAINVITNLPTDRLEAGADVSAGNYNALMTREFLSGPVLPHLLVRLAIATDNHSGYSLNLFNGRSYDDQNTQSARLTAIFDGVDRVSFTTVGDYHREHDGDYAIHLGGILNPAMPLLGVLQGGSSIPLGSNGLAIDPRLLDDYSLPRNRRDSWGVSEDAKWTLTDDLTINSLTAYRHFTGFYGTNLTGTTWPFPSDFAGYNYVQFADTQQFSEELQLLGKAPKLDWVMGLYYLHSLVTNGGYSFGLNPAPNAFPLTTGGSLRKPAYAAFGQATYHVTEKLGATLGLRYSEESNDANTAWTSAGMVLSGFGPCVNLPGQLCHLVESAHFSSLTPRFEVHYQWTENAMTYVSANKGFKSGGFEIAALTPAFSPAIVWTYEAGAKLQGESRRWATNMAVFHSEYTNMQVQEVTPAGITQIVNAAKSKIDGTEIEGVVRPIGSLEISDAFAYLDARYTSFSELNSNYPAYGPNAVVDNSGHQLQYNSKLTNNLRASYEWSLPRGSLRLAGEWNWRSKQYFSEYNDPFEEQDPYSLYSAFLRYTSQSKAWSWELFGKNLSNALVISQTSISGCACLNSQYLPPRTYGVTVSYKYVRD